MKKLLFVISIVALLLVAGVFSYRYYAQKRPEIWQLVPSNAFLVYESIVAGKSWNTLTSKPVWNSLSAIPFFDNAEKEIQYLDSISGKDGSLDKLFRNFEFVASFHVSSSSSFDVLYFLDLHNSQNLATFERMVSVVEGNFAFNKTSRIYQDIEIIEIKKKGEEKKFAFLIHKDYFIGSYSPVLVEDVVRNIKKDYGESFYDEMVDLKSVSKLEDDEGNVYLAYRRLAAAINIFLDNDKEFAFGDLVRLAENSFLDLKITDNELLLNGTTKLPHGHPAYFLSIFTDQNPGKINIEKILPDNTAVFVGYTFTDLDRWKQNMSRYWSATNEKLLENWMDFMTENEFAVDWIDGEIGMAIMEAVEVKDPDRVLLIKAKNPEETFGNLENLATAYAEKHNDSVYLEDYGDRKIVQLSATEWPKLFLGDLFGGFENSYISVYDKYIVVGNSLDGVKQFMQANEAENTWGKNVRQSLFLENTLGEANLSLMVNTDKAWNFILNLLNDEWKSLFKTYEPQIKSLDRLAFQWSNLDGNFYTSCAIGHQKVDKPRINTSRFKTLLNTYTIGEITTRPYLVRNHNNDRWEVMVQDKSNILYLISNEGMVLWGDSLKAPIVTDIHQIDYYKNNKLQYLFATANEIHLLDRNGHYVENFPIKLDSRVKLDHLSVVDYNNTREYRLMAADEGGDIYLFDKEKANLEGWRPRDLSGTLVSPGKHIRVKGGDCMIAFQKNGILNVMNRRGNMYSGFPFDFKENVDGDLFINIGNDFKSTSLSSITRSGEFISVNLQGDVLKREQLYKPSKECKFWLVQDALEKTYLIVRQEYNNLSFITPKGDILFEKNIIGSSELNVQYYFFSADRQLVVVNDLEQEFSYIFNQSGDLINLEPIESSHPVSILYYSRDKTYHIYKCFGNNVSILTAGE